jgi:outer membrane lipoprotein-sorting protein
MAMICKGRIAGAVMIALVALAGPASAQTAPPSAATVLSNVQKYYAAANHLTAQFQQIVTNVTFEKTQKSGGNLYVAKPALFRWDYVAQTNMAGAVTKTFAYDGTTLWVVDHQNKKILENKPQGSVLPAAVSFLTGGSGLAANFNVALDTSGKYGKTVLALTPKQPSAQYKQLFFVVDPSNWRVTASIVIDSSGDSNEFHFYLPDLKADVPPSLFQVDPAKLPTYKLEHVGP